MSTSLPQIPQAVPSRAARSQAVTVRRERRQRLHDLEEDFFRVPPLCSGRYEIQDPHQVHADPVGTSPPCSRDST